MPEGSGSSDSHPSFQDGALFATFLPNDGQESALARLMIAATNTAMDCHARANSNAAEVRDLELNYAIRLSVVTAGLSKAFDHHRASKQEDFIDDTVPIDRYLNFPTKESSEPAQDQTSEQKPDPLPKKRIELQRAWQRISETQLPCWRVLAAERGPFRSPCRSPAVHGKRRCRMHGGAKGSGAPHGNKNALKHGAYTREALNRRAQMRSLIREARKLLRDLG